MAKPKFGALSSSTNPEKFSLTAGSIAALITSLIALFFTMKGVQVPTDLSTQVENVVRMAMASVSGIGVVVSAVTGVIGAIRKLASSFANRK